MDPPVLPWLQPVGTSQWHARHMCGGIGGLYLKSAWFLHNKIFASLTPRSLLVIPFSRSVEAVQHTADHILPQKNFSASPFFPRRDPNLLLDQRFGTKGCGSMHKSSPSELSKSFAWLRNLHRFAQPPRNPWDSHRAMAA